MDDSYTVSEARSEKLGKNSEALRPNLTIDIYGGRFTKMASILQNNVMASVLRNMASILQNIESIL